MNNLLKAIVLAFLIPCAAFAQVLPDTLKSELQDGTEIDVVNGYDVNGNTCFEENPMLCHKLFYR